MTNFGIAIRVWIVVVWTVLVATSGFINPQSDWLLALSVFITILVTYVLWDLIGELYRRGVLK